MKEVVPTSEPTKTFWDLGLDEKIIKSLDKLGYHHPTPVQENAIPLILERKDLIALAQTGSGKTAACAIPICHQIDVHQLKVQALIIVPTRELALQYATESQKIGKNKGVKVFAIFGGEDMELQQSKLKHGVHVLVATPGRLIDFIYSRSIDLTAVQTIILDEADEMLSMGFYDDLEFVINCIIQPHQTLLFSATMPKEIRKLAKVHMKDPIEITLNKEAETSKLIDHYFLYCHYRHREDTLLKQILEQNPKQAIIFCHSRIQVEKVQNYLRQHLKQVDYLHAGLNQNLRTSITDKFRKQKIRFLVATDVASRGLDFSDVTHVFIYQLSDDPDLYVHRSGRTGRYDRKGTVITLVTNRELGTLKSIFKKLHDKPKWIGEPPKSP